LTLLLLLSVLDDAQGGEQQPTPAMMQPVKGLVAFMSTLPPSEHPDVFSHHGLCIVENFSPFIFFGPRAAAQWEAGFRAHAGELSGLVATFGEAFDFSVSGRRAYFSLPTTWTGLSQGRHFEEHGAWSFVLESERPGPARGQWRIVGYGWGVTAYSETTP